MNAAGIDVSSRKSTVAVLRPFGEVVHMPFDVVHILSRIFLNRFIRIWIFRHRLRQLIDHIVGTGQSSVRIARPFSSQVTKLLQFLKGTHDTIAALLTDSRKPHDAVIPGIGETQAKAE